MLFHEIYGSYYRIVSEILNEALRGGASSRDITRIISEKGFAESTLTIPAALSDGTWPLLTQDGKTPIRSAPAMPLTLLQKRWLKTLLDDPRIRLFDPPADGLEGVEPLFTQEMLVYYDRYTDGDPYGDPAYIGHFHTILTALREKRKIRIRFKSSHGTRNSRVCIPYRIEYSPKDDKFRVLTVSGRSSWIVNLSRITSCQLLEPYDAGSVSIRLPRRDKLVLEVTDERNALERVMLHFSHLEKEVQRIDEKHYRLTLHYEREDVTELVIRVLSFGPVVRVIEPESFIQKVRQRIEKQQKLRA